MVRRATRNQNSCETRSDGTAAHPSAWAPQLGLAGYVGTTNGMGSGSNRLRLDADRIVDRITEPLLASQIALCRLDAEVPEQELNSFQLATAVVAQPNAYPTSSMTCHIAEIAGLARLLYNVSDDFGADDVLLPCAEGSEFECEGVSRLSEAAGLEFATGMRKP